MTEDALAIALVAFKNRMLIDRLVLVLGLLASQQAAQTVWMSVKFCSNVPNA